MSSSKSGSKSKKVVRTTMIPSNAAIQRLVKSAGGKKSSDDAKSRIGLMYRMMVEDIVEKCAHVADAMKTSTLSAKILNIVLGSMSESVLTVPKAGACKSKTAMLDVYKRCEIVPRGSFERLVTKEAKEYGLKSTSSFKLAIQYHVESKLLNLVKGAYAITLSRPGAIILMERDIETAQDIKK